LEAGETDFVQHVGAPLPSILICDLVGVPVRDRSYVMALTQDAFGDAEEGDADRQVSANAELFAYCDELVTNKRRHPGDDVATALAEGVVAGRPMSHETAVLNCHDLFAAGNETARHTSAAALLTMTTHPSEWADLRDGAVSFESATEELLRYEASVSHVLRVALEDVEVGGVTFRAGEFVTLWLRSANRDELVFDRPDYLIFSRSPNNHVTFGRGAHFCLGSHLARLEIASLLRALVELVATVELAGEPTRLASSFLRGFRSLPVRLHGR
jgi:cytochrome P450